LLLRNKISDPETGIARHRQFHEFLKGDKIGFIN